MMSLRKLLRQLVDVREYRRNKFLFPRRPFGISSNSYSSAGPRAPHAVFKSVQPPPWAQGVGPLTAKENMPASLLDLRIAQFGDIYWVERDKVRFPRSFSLDASQNPLVRYLAEGYCALADFYDKYQPVDQVEAVLLDPAKVDEYRPVRYPMFRHPWTRSSYAFTGEWPLGWLCGPHHDSPVATQRIELEARRMDTLVESIGNFGFFFPTKKDQPRFWLLIDDSDAETLDYRAVLKVGHHRVASLAHLGWSVVPLTPVREMCIEVRLSDADSWPGVLDGTFSGGAARQIFFAYFRPAEAALISGW